MVRQHKQTGFGLVEILVGLVISMLVVITAYGTLIFFQTYNRTGIGANSALENGIGGLYAIEHDVKSSGLGFLAKGSIVCSTLNMSYGSQNFAMNTPVIPVAIADGGKGPDSITVMYANNILAASPVLSSASTNIANSSINVYSPLYFQSGNLAMISNLANLSCTVVRITAVSNNQLTFDAGASPNTAYPANSLVANIGGLTWNTWRINNSVLEVFNKFSNTTVTIADNVVQMQAQYGISNGLSPNVQQWVDATGQWAALNSALISQIRAVRVAIVARSPVKEKPSVYGAACDATKQAPLPWPGGTAIDLSTDPNWRCYRYKVFKTVIALPNAIMGGLS